MAWSNSKPFNVFLENCLENTTAFALGSDSIMMALYVSTITPDQTVTAANSAYNAGQWATANEVYQAGQWAQAGVTLSGVTSGFTANTYALTATSPSSGSAATLSDVTGALVYDGTLATPVADQGICYLYAGGSSSVAGGTLTANINASGLLTYAH